MKTLHLVLKSKWYDKIASGEKTSECRECKPYWNKRLGMKSGMNENHVVAPLEPKYNRVVFHRGYTNDTIEFEIKDIDITYQTNDLRLPKVWEIKLGQRIK